MIGLSCNPRGIQQGIEFLVHWQFTPQSGNLRIYRITARDIVSQMVSYPNNFGDSRHNLEIHLARLDFMIGQKRDIRRWFANAKKVNRLQKGAGVAVQLKNARKKKAGKSIYLVPAVDKALDILALLRTDGREMNLAEISKATGSHKSSVQRLMTTLSHHGFVKRDEMTKRYALGIALAEYGRIALNNLDIRQLAKPFLQALVDYSGETAVLAILNDTKMVWWISGNH